MNDGLNYIWKIFVKAVSGEYSEPVGFEPNPLYEGIISDLLERRYSLVHNFLSPEVTESLRGELQHKYAEDRFKKAAVGNRFNEHIQRSIRGDFIFWIDRGQVSIAESAFLHSIDSLVAYLNRTCFLGVIQSEFHYAVYPRGSFYRRHLDTFQNDDRRKLSVVCYLNEPDWSQQDGGELVLYPESEDSGREVIIVPTPGLMVVFESQELEHEVKPAMRERLSITAWLKTR